MRLNWMPAFLKQLCSNKRSTICKIWENNPETFEKLISTIQSRCSIYNHSLKPLHGNIHEFWNQVLTVMKIRRFRKYRKTPHISPWAYTIQRAFLIGLYVRGLGDGGGLIHGVIIKLAISTFLVKWNYFKL